MILTSQTLGGDSIPSTTISQIAIRILLQCSENDSVRVLSSNNTEAKLLSKPGEGIYNTENGAISGNIKFQTFWMEDKEAIELLKELKKYTSSQNYKNKAKIFREDIKPNFIEYFKYSKFSKSTKKIALGQPYSLENSIFSSLNKKETSNVLIAGNNEYLASQLFLTYLISLSLDTTTKNKFFIINNSDDESVIDEYIDILCENDIDIDMLNKRNTLDKLEKLNTKINNFIDGEKNTTRYHLLFFGLFQSRNFRKDGYSLSKESELFSKILENGSEFGVHSIIYLSSIKQMKDMFEVKTMTHDFNQYISLQMSEDDSRYMVGNDAASNLGDDNAYYFEQDKNYRVKFRPLELPNKLWLENSLNKMKY